MAVLLEFSELLFSDQHKILSGVLALALFSES